MNTPRNRSNVDDRLIVARKTRPKPQARAARATPHSLTNRSARPGRSPRG